MSCLTPRAATPRRDDAILQRAPAKAALYGRVAPVPPSGATVEVTVTPSLGGESSFPAEMFADGTWKVLLNCKEKCDDKGMPHGCCTNYTRTAGCEHNNNNNNNINA